MSNLTESSQIAKGTTIKGTIKTSEDIRIDGIVDGDLDTSGKLIVGTEGKITGKMKTNTAVVSGNLDIENIQAENLSFTKDAKFKGNASYKSISIEEGAEINGQLTKISK